VQRLELGMYECFIRKWYSFNYFLLINDSHNWQVYAIEASGMAAEAERIVEANGLSAQYN
jgi:hypothetical protein